MEFEEYAIKVHDTNLLPGNTLYHILGLMSEVGELAEYVTCADEKTQEIINQIRLLGAHCSDIKRDIRDKGNHKEYFIIGFDENIESELGDILYYIFSLISSFNMTAEDIGRANNKKLQARKLKGTIKGKGDKR
jgi:NTP pyrophosphatase (non-canonical NTP hydrolase)